MLAIAALLSSCAAARVIHVDGRPVVTAIAVGASRVTVCEDGMVTLGTSPGGAVVGPCVVVQGGALSTSFVDFVGTVASAVVAYFTAGAVPGL